MRTLTLTMLVVMQFTLLPFFTMLASARDHKVAVIQSGISVVYKTTDEWPDWLKQRLSQNF